MEQCVDAVLAFVWGMPMLVLLVGTGIYFTVRLGFFQLRHVELWLKKTLGSCLNGSAKESGGNGLSAFGTMCTALAATVGTGNIAGVATALVFGGPGAIFWMWASALFGMMTGFAENVLGMRYRMRDASGAWQGGPMYYLERGVGSRGLAVIFSVCCVLASFGIGNMCQCNSIAGALGDTFGVDARVTGIVTAVLLAFALAGGLGRVAKIAESLVPFMAFFYIAGAVLVLILNHDRVGDAFALIFRYAFRLRAGVGGVAGYTLMRTMRNGVARGIFSNEAGLGSSVMVHTASNLKEPCEQGMWSVFEVGFNTILLCTVTALAILSSGVYDVAAYEAALASGTLSALPSGGTLTVLAFNTIFGRFGGVFVSVALILFAFSTLLGWSLYGERAVVYLVGQRAVWLYKVLFVVATAVGCVMQMGLVWKLSDIFNGFMALPNLIGILWLLPEVVRAWRDYQSRHKAAKRCKES